MGRMELQRKWSLGLPVEAKSGEDLRRHCLLKAAARAIEGVAMTATSAPVDPSARTLVIDLECLCSNVCFYDRTQGFVQRVMPRPHVRLFLESVRAHFRLAVWSVHSRAWMSCALSTLDPAQEFLDFRSQLAAAASDVDYETEGLPTILDDGQGVDPSDVVVVTLCRAAFGSLADSVIEVPPYDIHVGGATGQGYDTVLLSLAAVLVRHLGLNAVTSGAADVAAADGGGDGDAAAAGIGAGSAHEQKVLRLEGDEGSCSSGAAAGEVVEVAPPAPPQRRPVREELRRLGLSETRFGEAALGLLGGECPAAVSYMLEDMAPQRNPHAPHPHGRLHVKAGSRASAAAARGHRAPEVVLEEEDEGAEAAAQPWQQHELATSLTPLQLSRLELVDVRADMALPASLASPTSPASPAALPSPVAPCDATAAASAASGSSTLGASACSGASAAASSSGSSAARSSAASATGLGCSAADAESHAARVPSCFSLRWRSARRRAVEQGECPSEAAVAAATSSRGMSVAPSEPGSPDGLGAQLQHASPLTAAFRRLSTAMRHSLRRRTVEATATTAPGGASGIIPPASSLEEYSNFRAPHGPSALAAAAACECSVLSEPESCDAAAQSAAVALVPYGVHVQLPRDSELLAQRGSNQSDSSACSVATLGSGLSTSTAASSISGCVGHGYDCLAHSSSGSISGGGVGASGTPRPSFAHGRSNETLQKVLGVAQPTACAAAAPNCGSAQRQDVADADAPAMAAAAARMLNAAMRARCPELPGGRIALLCGQPSPSGAPIKSMRAKSGFVTPVPAVLASDRRAAAGASDAAADTMCEHLPVHELPCATDAASPADGELSAAVPGAEASEDDTHPGRAPHVPNAPLSSASFTSSAAAAAAAVFGEGCSGSGSRAGSLEALDRASLSEPGMLSRLDLPLSMHDTMEL